MRFIREDVAFHSQGGSRRIEAFRTAAILRPLRPSRNVVEFRRFLPIRRRRLIVAAANHERRPLQPFAFRLNLKLGCLPDRSGFTAIKTLTGEVVGSDPLEDDLERFTDYFVPEAIGAGGVAWAGSSHAILHFGRAFCRAATPEAVTFVSRTRKAGRRLQSAKGDKSDTGVV